jgi:cation diffusion facilitator family transporter
MTTGDDQSRRAILAALAANLGIAIAKFVGFLVTGSGSMLGESVHSLADTGNQGLLVLGGRRARRPPSPEHPFGHGRERYFWAFEVAVVLFTMGSVFAVVEGIEKLLHPHEVESAGWAIGILAVAVVLEANSFRTAIHAGNAVRGQLSWWDYIRKARAPEVPVDLLEDSAALVGLVIALAAVGAAAVTGDSAWDGAGTVAIGVLLGGVAAVLAVEMKSLLMGEPVVAGEQDAIRAAIEDAPPVVRLIHLRTEHLGPDDVLVGAKVEFSSDLDIPRLADAVDAVEARVRAVVPAARWIYIEPDICRD